MEAQWSSVPPEACALLPEHDCSAGEMEACPLSATSPRSHVHAQGMTVDLCTACERWQWQARGSAARALALTAGRKGALLLAVTVLASALVAELTPRAALVVGTWDSANQWRDAQDLWSSNCPADTPLVHQLRQQPWPKLERGKAPKVSKVIYINMKWDPIRRRYMEEQLQNLSQTWRRNVTLRWERLEGVGAQHVENDKAFSAWRKKGFSKAPFPAVAGDWAVAGCSCSHYAAIKKIPAKSKELVLIAEDDVELSPSFPNDWEELWQWMPEDWDVVRVGWFGDHQNCSQVVNSRIDLAAWQQLDASSDCMYCGAQAYIVNPKSKRKVLDRFEISRMTHADELLSAPTPLMEDPSKVPPLKVFVTWPLLAKTHMSKSGYPAFKSDRIQGRGAVKTASARTDSEQERWLPSTSRSTSIDNRYAIHWPTTTSGLPDDKEPLTEESEEQRVEQEAKADAQAAARSKAQAAGEASKKVEEKQTKRLEERQTQKAEEMPTEKAEARKTEKAEQRQNDEVTRMRSELEEARQQAERARKKAEASQQALREATEVAHKAWKEAQDSLHRKAKQLAVAAAEQVEKRTKEAEEKAADVARREADEKASKVERQAKESAQLAHEAAGRVEVWKKAEHEAEVAAREASKRADQSQALEQIAHKRAAEADKARKRAEGQAAQIQDALEQAEAAKKKAEAELKEEISARKSAESAKKTAVAELAKVKGQRPALPQLTLPTLPPLVPQMETLAPLLTSPVPSLHMLKAEPGAALLSTSLLPLHLPQLKPLGTLPPLLPLSRPEANVHVK
mmetsp:Transcript_22051/g.51434  ORF Transcript_22051/g.51434 Transcript_22051/m.51434 type:complete len:795 (-) Transcript_22051:88-2472(-)